MTEPTTLEQQLEAEVSGMVARLLAMGSDPYVRDAIANIVIRDLCWELIKEDGMNVLHHDLADHLEMMAGLLRQEGKGAK